MNVLIMPSDSLVVVDGVGCELDLSSIDIDMTNIHAICFDGVKGEMQHKNGALNSTFGDAGFIRPFIELHEVEVAKLNEPLALPEYKLEASERASQITRQKIHAGFNSDALDDQNHFYPNSSEDQFNLASARLSGLSMPILCADDTGVWKRRSHNRSELRALHADAERHKRELRAELDVVRAEINNASDYATVDSAIDGMQR